MKYEDLKQKIEPVKIELEKTRIELVELYDQKNVILRQLEEYHKIQVRPLNEIIRQLEEQLQELEMHCEIHPNFEKNWSGICPTCGKYVMPSDDGLSAHM